MYSNQAIASAGRASDVAMASCLMRAVGGLSVVDVLVLNASRTRASLCRRLGTVGGKSSGDRPAVRKKDRVELRASYKSKPST